MHYKRDTARHEATLRRAIAERGMRLTPFGIGLRLVGPGVDMLFTDWRFVRTSDLQPYRGPQQ